MKFFVTLKIVSDADLTDENFEIKARGEKKAEDSRIGNRTKTE